MLALVSVAILLKYSLKHVAIVRGLFTMFLSISNEDGALGFLALQLIRDLIPFQVSLKLVDRFQKSS